MSPIAEDFNQSLDIARKVLPFLGKQKIPATPENYMIFYLYFEGGQELVKKLVDEQLDNDALWTRDTTRHLFAQLFSVEANLDFYKKNAKMAREVQAMTQGILAETKSTAELAQKTSQNISNSIDQMGKVKEIKDAAKWLKEALAEVKAVGDASDNLTGNLLGQGRRLEEIVETLGQMETMALTDELTQLPNRRAWDNRITEAFTEFKQSSKPSCLLILDLDDFKRINDSFGHLVGDQALKEVSRLTRCGVRETDFPARYGGEEIVCLMPETDLEEARLIAEKLRLSIAGTQFTVRGKQTPVTASFGVSSFHPEDSDQRGAMQRADMAMYLAKSKGKNRVMDENQVAAAKSALERAK